MQIQQLLTNNELTRLDNRLLISKVTGFSHAQIIANNDYSLSTAQLKEYNQLLNRAIKKEPIAYILGMKEFYSREYKVTYATLIPRPETELLVETVISYAQPNTAVLDMGTGSGCIAITCKLERPDLVVHAIDNYADTLAIAEENASALKAEIVFKQSDWFSNITDKFDIIVSNPPYIDANDHHLQNLPFEPLRALTDFENGLSMFSQIIQQSSKYLKQNGYLIFEHGYNQAEKIREMLYNYGYTNIQTIKDYANQDRVTIGQIITAKVD